MIRGQKNAVAYDPATRFGIPSGVTWMNLGGKYSGLVDFSI